MPHPVDTHVGKRLKELRNVRRLSQTDVAQALDLSFQQIQKYEIGSNRIAASRLFEIAKILEVHPTYFFMGLDESSELLGIWLDVFTLVGKLPEEEQLRLLQELKRRTIQT